MVYRLKKYRYYFIFLVLLVALFSIPSPYSFLHYENPPFLSYLFIIFINTLIFLTSTKKLIVSEKIFYSMVSSVMALILGIYLIDVILGFFYGYDDFYGELNAPMLLKTILFYFSTSSISIALFAVGLRYKKNIYE